MAHFQCDGLPHEGLEEDLHTTTKTENEVRGAIVCACGSEKGLVELGMVEDRDVAHDDITFIIAVLLRIVWLSDRSIGCSVVFTIILLA
jgi:hypothetical protein